MTNGYDGSIRIDSKIDEKGFNNGINNLGKSLKGIKGVLGVIGSAIGKVFGLAGVAIAAVVGAVLGFVMVFKKLEKSVKSVSDLKASFDQLKNSLAYSFAPIVMMIIPILQKIVSWLVKVINTVAQVIAALFGQKTVMQAIADDTSASADAAGALADNTKKAGKAAKGALAAFDELNVLQMQDKTTGGGAATGPGFIEVPVTSKIQEVIEKIKGWFVAAWQWISGAAKSAFDFIVGIWSAFSEWFQTKVWDPVVSWFTDHVLGPLYMKFQELKGYFMEFWGAVGQPIIDWLVSNVWPVFKWIGEKLWGLLQITLPATLQFFWGVVKSVFQLVIDIVKNFWSTLTGIFKGVITAFEGVLQFLTGIFTGNWTKAMEGIKRIFSGIWDSMVAISRGAVNLIIDVINAMVRAVFAGINAVLSALNKIKIDIPAMLGKPGFTFGLNLPSISAPQIPRLATGAVIPPNAQFLAMLGDQRHGTNIEAPEGLIRQIIQEEMGSQSVTVNFTGTMSELIRVLNPEIKREDIRIGKSLLSGGSI